MRISTEKQPDLQPILFEEFGYEARVCTVAACRNYMGDFFEEATCKLVRGVRLKTDSTAEVCPDIKVSDNCFIESKSVGCSGEIIVYHNRLEKDLAFVRSHGVQLWYVFWQHACRVNDGIELGTLRSKAALTVKSVTFMRLDVLSALLQEQPIKVLNSKHTARGYGSLGYREGWNYRLSVLAKNQPRHVQEVELSVYGREVKNFSIHGDILNFTGSVLR